jgi:hypothetical protein
VLSDRGDVVTARVLGGSYEDGSKQQQHKDVIGVKYEAIVLVTSWQFDSRSHGQ